MQTPVRIRPAASFPLKFDELESSGSTTSTGVHSLSVELSHRWLAGGTGSRTGSLGPVAPLWVECPNDRKFFKITDKNWRRRQDLNRGWRFCSAQRRPKTKGTLRVLLRFSRLTLVDVGLVLADNGSGLGTAPACPPLPLCSRDGRRVLLRMHQHSSRERHEDGGEGDDRSIAHGHGLSSDDHDDAGVDSDLPLAGRGNNGRPRTESASGDPVAGMAPSTSSQSTPNCARLVPEIVVYCQPSGSISR